MKLWFVLLTFLMTSGSALKAGDYAIMSADSVGHKWENGKLFVLHRVDKGQTAFAISRRYGTSVDAIKEANSGSINLVAGQIVKVPYTRYKRVPASPAPTPGPGEKIASEGKTVPNSPKPDLAGTHTVEVGNTLYSIATRYGVSVSEVKTWNGLKSDQVMLGQVLIVSSGKFAENNQTPKVSVASQSDSALTTPVPAANLVKNEPVKATAATSLKSVRQNGLAEKIDVGGSSPKYLALHRDAPIGTLIQVTNQTNQQVIWAKVIGRIPDTSINEDIVIKLSGSAFDKISPQTRRFRAEVTYSEKAE